MVWPRPTSRKSPLTAKGVGEHVIVLLRWNPGWVATAMWIGREVTGATSAPEDARDGRFADAEEFPDALVGMPATLIRLDK